MPGTARSTRGPMPVHGREGPSSPVIAAAALALFKWAPGGDAWLGCLWSRMEYAGRVDVCLPHTVPCPAH